MSFNLEDRIKQLETLVDANQSSPAVGALLMSSDARGNTLLHLAVSSDKVALMRTILQLSKRQSVDRGVMLNHLLGANQDGDTALHLAAKCNATAVGDILKTAQCCVDWSLVGATAIISQLIGANQDGDTPVILAGDAGLSVAVNRIFDFMFANMKFIGKARLDEQLEAVKNTEHRLDSSVKQGMLKLLKLMFNCDFDC